MANCFLCGRKIAADIRQARRRVKTGEWIRKRYESPRIKSTQSHFGMRIVCPACATFLDRQQIKDELWRHAGVLVLLVGLFFLVMLRY